MIGAPTPGRRTVFNFDYGVESVIRPAFHIRRSADQIGTALLRTQPQQGNQVMLFPTHCWSLKPYFQDSYYFITNQSVASGSVISSSQMNVAQGVQRYEMHKAPTDKPGSGPNTGGGPSQQINTGGEVLQKTVDKQSEDWGHSLVMTGMPPPTPPEDLDFETLQVRVMQEIVRNPPNTGYSFRFNSSRRFWGRGVFAHMYFGGACPVAPNSESGGLWCIAFYGEGRGILYERHFQTATWKKREGFFWCDPHDMDDRTYIISAVPHANDRMILSTYSSTPAGGGTNIFDVASSFIARKFQPGHVHPYIELPSLSGHKHLNSMSGIGGVSVDFNSTARHPFMVTRCVYPGTAPLVDSPFTTEHVLPVNTPMTVRAEWHNPGNGANLSVRLFGAKSNTMCGLDGSGNHLSLGGETSYYAIFTFTAAADLLRSPTLFYYTVDGPMEHHVDATMGQSGGRSRSVDLSGPDLAGPDHESVSFVVKDPGDELPALRGHDRVTVSIDIVDSYTYPLPKTVRIFEGRTTRVTGHKRGRRRLVNGVPRLWPSENWHDYSGRAVGRWGDLKDQRVVGWMDFYMDPFGVKDEDGHAAPWKITDILKWLFSNAGWNADEIAIPDLPVRLWPSPEVTQSSYVLTSGMDYVSIAQRLTHDSLGMALAYNYAVNTRGAWTLITNPDPNFTVWNFVPRRPITINNRAIPTSPHTMGVNSSFIQDDSFFTDIEAPEFNYISVSTVGQLLPSNGSPMRYSNWMFNKKSVTDRYLGVDSDGNQILNLDYLGKTVPAHVVDPYIGGFSRDPAVIQGAVDSTLLRYYEFGAHGHQWARFVAPLQFVIGGNVIESRPRIMMLNDVVRVGGYKFVIRSCNPSYKDDRAQMANYHGVFLNEEAALISIG